jgi:hypothetical protein
MRVELLEGLGVEGVELLRTVQRQRAEPVLVLADHAV